MERIQSAIAKARAERHVTKGESRATLAPALDPDSTFADRWAALSGFVPDNSALTRKRVYPGPAGYMGSMFDVLRTRILQQMAANGWRRLGITSPTAACGKSTIALNLAFGITRQPERRVILAELDLRRPSLASILGLRDEIHFANTLDGQESFARNARSLGGNLAITCNSAPVMTASDLIHSSTLPLVLDRVQTDYAPDVMIFDLPPMTAGDDTLALARHVDAILIVAAAEATTIRQVDNCEQELAQQTNILGVVLNKCRYMEKQGDYSYDYS